MLERFLEVTSVITDQGLGQNIFQYLKNSLFSYASGVAPHDGWNENKQIKPCCCLIRYIFP
jgi:hypothetical protein